MRAGVLQLSRWGVLPELVAAGTPGDPPHRLPLRRRRGRRVTLRATPWRRRPVRTAPAPPRPGARRGSRRLGGRRAARDTGRWGCSATTTAASSASVSRATEGGEVAVRAALTVGADGMGSLVAREVGAQVVTQGRAASAVLYRYVDQVPSDGYVWAYGDSAAAAA